MVLSPKGGCMRVLIAYGSKRGGTAGLARMIGDEFTALGLQTSAQPARKVLRFGIDGRHCSRRYWVSALF